ncbi:DUF2911 domain-containing protein [Cyclobacterium plantarum]|uniref:DUF2911 domain-containing protein n=1 Tax=Cyclobacterium plantarum TaxID=2716263 RepID=A0ABX0HBM2_9BACT|nr:DUF2911 domain-containing protein [Cyclobacterium plantarum]NHE58765.1 DUF2911 domain-containing protein [Cyclobacterium plantarum]
MKTKNLLFLITILSLIHINGFSQIKMPQASPSSKVVQQVGLTEIHLDYSRPGKKGRKIFGELVPYGQVWRTGANNPTTLEFDTDIKVNGQKLAAGKYAFYTVPNKNQWTLIFSNKTELWGAMGYDAKDDALRVTVPVNKLKKPVESMTIQFAELTDSGATVQLAWDKSQIGFRIETEVDPIVMKQIREMLIDQDSDNPGLYFQAANYYFTNDKDLDTALEWINKAVEADPKYYIVHLKAKIQAAQGMKMEAIATAEQSMELAREANNPDYVSLNERLISSLK